MKTKKETIQVPVEDMGSNKDCVALSFFKRMGSGPLIKILSKVTNHYDLFRLKKT